MELDLFSLKYRKVSGTGFCGVCGFGMALDSLSFNAQGCVSALIANYHGMSCSGTCWLLGRTWFQCRYGGFWMSSCLLMFPGIRSSLIISSFGFKFPSSGFQFYSNSRLNTSPSIQHR